MRLQVHGKPIRWQLDYLDPNPPFGAMYMLRPAIEAMIQKLRTDEAYFQACNNNDPYIRDLFDMWRDATGAKAWAMRQPSHQTPSGCASSSMSMEGSSGQCLERSRKSSATNTSGRH